VFDQINGLPVHPLVVHSVVVLLPLAAIGTIAIAARPVWRGPYGVLVVLFAAVATALTLIAKESGQELAARVGNPGDHGALGNGLIWFAIPLLLLALALVYLDRRHAAVHARDPEADDRTLVALNIVAVLAIIAALVATVQVYRVGDSGARVTWGHLASTPGGSS
jgi:uncharacterized membrane protein